MVVGINFYIIGWDFEGVFCLEVGKDFYELIYDIKVSIIVFGLIILEMIVI